MSKPKTETENLREIQEPEHDDILQRASIRAVSSDWFTYLQIREHEIVVGELIDLDCWGGTQQSSWTHLGGYPVRTQNKRHLAIPQERTFKLHKRPHPNQANYLP